MSNTSTRSVIRRQNWLLASLAGLMATAAVAQPAPPSYSVPEYPDADTLPQIRFSMTESNSSTSDAAMQTFALVDYVKKASKGRIDIDVYWSGSLMSFGETARGIASGTADMGMALPGYTPSDFPVSNWFTQLASLTNSGFPAGWLIVTGAVNEFLLENGDISKEYEDFGLHIVGGVGTGGYDNLCSKPWSTLAEIRGKRIRTPGQAFAQQVQALGGVDVPTTSTEVYEAFSRGIIDCVIQQPNSYVSSGITEIPGKKWWVNVPLTSFNAAHFLFNKDKWDELPPTAQAIIKDAVTLYFAMQPHAIGIGFRKFGELVRGGSIEPLAVAPEVNDAIRAFDRSVIAAMPGTAPRGVSDPQTFIAQYTTLVDKWTKIVVDMGFPNDRVGVEDLDGIIDTWFEDYDFTSFSQRLNEELAKVPARR